MYVPEVFGEQDEGRITEFVDRHPLATLIVVDGGRAHADHLPFLRTDRLVIGGSLFSHVARPNRTWRIAESGPEVLLVFSGAAAYISPSLYPTKQETHEVVPTYNYVSVHVRGRLTCSHDPAVKRRCVERLTQRMEASRAEPWSVADAPPAYIDRMLEGFVALTLEVGEITAKSKSSQNRLPRDQLGVLEGLRADPATLEAAQVIATRLGRLTA